jgi:peptidoglycan hydrolase-like protein with peptidoglycan-binding domain
MKDVLEEGGDGFKPLAFLAHGASLILSCAIIYNAFFGQHVKPAQRLAGAGLSTRVEVSADENPNTIVLRYDPKVEEVQRGLLASGDYKGMVDGVAGKQTRLAIEAYQKKSGLTVDGQITDELIEHIRFTQQFTEAAQFTGSIAKPAQEADVKQMREIQTALAELGYQPGEITGGMNAATREAITKFQRDRDLPENGEVTPDLMAEIAKLSGDSSVAAE